MRNVNKKTELDEKSVTSKILGLVVDLPYFEIETLEGFTNKQYYLKIALSRLEKQGKIARLKKGVYVSSNFIDKAQKKGIFDFYLEFLSGIIYHPAYLSLDYVLGKYNGLTEAPVNFTAITKNKTAIFSNQLGNFAYHKVRPELFIGFNLIKTNNLMVYQATKAKALFDYVYLRKNLLINAKSVSELRINVEVFSHKDKAELKKYIKLEKSKKIKDIFELIF